MTWSENGTAPGSERVTFEYQGIADPSFPESADDSRDASDLVAPYRGGASGRRAPWRVGSCAGARPRIRLISKHYPGRRRGVRFQT